MVKEIIVEPIYNDDEIEKKEGHWFNHKDIKQIINFDADIKKHTPNGLKTIAVFRKKYLPPDLSKIAFNSFHKAALPSRGRGAAAGIINKDSVYWGKRIPIKTDKWSTSYIVNGMPSKMKVNNQVASNVIGYYEATPFLKLPARMTNYTRNHLQKIKTGLPYIHKLSQFYKQFLPKIYNIQKDALKEKKNFTIPNTVFSSITINRNFRTGMHKDAGNFEKGFAVMSVLERGKYGGAYTIFPQYGIGFDIREGDCIVFDNTKEWHCNSEFTENASQKKFNNNMEDIFKDNPEVGTAGLDNKFTRISFVAYLRQKILNSIETDHEYLIDFDGNHINKNLNKKQIKQTKQTKNNKQTKTNKNKKKKQKNKYQI